MQRLVFSFLLGALLALSFGVQAHSRVFSPNRHPTPEQEPLLNLPAPKQHSQKIVAHKSSKHRARPHKHRRQKIDQRIKKSSWKVKPSKNEVKPSTFKVKKAPPPSELTKPIQPSKAKIKPYRYDLK